MSDLNIYQKINEVRKKVGYIQRGSAGQGTGVLYDEVVAAARKMIVSQGIIITTDFLADNSRENTKKNYVYEAFIRVWYINMDNPDDKFYTDVVAHAMDAGDKAPGKAVTYATKISLVKVLFLETGINDESRTTANRAYSDDQYDMFHDILNEKNPLKFYCFHRTLSEDAYIALFNSFEKDKGKNKKICNEQITDGLEALQNVCDELNTLAEKGDVSASEVVAPLEDFEKRMIMKGLKPETIDFLKKLKE